jgi:hypothetical protein
MRAGESVSLADDSMEGKIAPAAQEEFAQNAPPV